MNGEMIAKQLGITPEAARMRLHRALKNDYAKHNEATKG